MAGFAGVAVLSEGAGALNEAEDARRFKGIACIMFVSPPDLDGGREFTERDGPTEESEPLVPGREPWLRDGGLIGLFVL